VERRQVQVEPLAQEANPAYLRYSSGAIQQVGMALGTRL
jgi:hypothetical protein